LLRPIYIVKAAGTLYVARITAQVTSWQGRKIPWSEIERCWRHRNHFSDQVPWLSTTASEVKHFVWRRCQLLRWTKKRIPIIGGMMTQKVQSIRRKFVLVYICPLKFQVECLSAFTVDQLLLVWIYC